jgi:hypothetical protein
VLPPRPLLAAAILLVGLLAWSVSALPPPLTSVEAAGRWEGQTVTVEGWAQDLRAQADGIRLLLVDSGHAVAVRAPAESDAGEGLQEGDRVRATGRLGRWQGQLRLDVETPDGVRRIADARSESPSWSDLALRPDRWEGRPLLLRGEVDDGRLLGPDGHAITLGEGPWPRDGTVQARGFLREDPKCLCHRFDAREVWPWTP